MPVICRKHFCGATAAEACGISDARPGWWFVGSPPGWGAPSCTGVGVPTAVDPVAFPALWFPTWLLEQFSARTEASNPMSSTAARSSSACVTNGS